MWRIRSIALLVAASAVVVQPVVGQHNTAETRASLRGLNGVYVKVHYVGPSDTEHGLTVRQLKDVAELRLSIDSVKVLTEDEWARVKGEPYLYINVIGTDLADSRNSAGDYLFTLNAELIQQTRLTRNPAIQTLAATWSEGYTMVVPREDRRLVVEGVENLTHQFIRALQSASQAELSHAD